MICNTPTYGHPIGIFNRLLSRVCSVVHSKYRASWFSVADLLSKRSQRSPSSPLTLDHMYRTGDHAALFSAVRAIRTKLVEGTSAPFDLPSRPTGHSHSRTGGGGPAGDPGMGGAADGQHHHGHRHGDDDDDPYNQNR